MCVHLGVCVRERERGGLFVIIKGACVGFCALACTHMCV